MNDLLKRCLEAADALSEALRCQQDASGPVASMIEIHKTRFLSQAGRKYRET